MTAGEATNAADSGGPSIARAHCVSRISLQSRQLKHPEFRKSMNSRSGGDAGWIKPGQSPAAIPFFQKFANLTLLAPVASRLGCQPARLPAIVSAEPPFRAFWAILIEWLSPFPSLIPLLGHTRSIKIGCRESIKNFRVSLVARLTWCVVRMGRRPRVSVYSLPVSLQTVLPSGMNRPWAESDSYQISGLIPFNVAGPPTIASSSLPFCVRFND